MHRIGVYEGEGYGIMSEKGTIDRVYHYTTKDRFESIIKKQEIWATSIHQFSDHLEFRLGRKQFLESARAALTSEEAEAAEEILLYLLSVDRPDLFVCSFTNADDSPLHWKEFGEYAIGFPFVELLSHAGMLGFQVHYCCYEPANQDIVKGFAGIVSKVISMCGGLKGFRSQFPFGNPLMDMFLTLIAKYKHHSYGGEKETRLVYHIPGFTRVRKLKVESGESSDSPDSYVAFSLKSQELWRQAEIVLGPCSGDDRERRLEVAKTFLGSQLKNKGLPTVCVDNIRHSQIP